MRKTYRYWNYENCYEEALKYKTRNEFRKGCVSAYNLAWRKGWLKDYTWFKEPHKQKSYGYWNYETCYQEALKYTTRSEFEKGCTSAYNTCLKHGWMDDYYWFEEVRKPKGYWDNYENCYQEALKYKTKKEFKKGCGTVYVIARKNKWLDDYTWFDGNKHWDKETCYQEALKYTTRSEFCKGCGSAYHAARKKGWLDDYIWFVDGKIKMYTNKNDSVYRYYWEETNAIYIGRTLISQQNNRKNNHSTSEEDTVYKYAKENGLAIPPMEIIEEGITPIEGLEREDYWVNYYKEKGYNVINKAKTGIGCGSLGRINSGKWTKENVFAEGQKYKTKKEFQKGCASAYQVARRKGWLSEMDWFEETIKPNGYWNVYENCYQEALKYQNRTEFARNASRAYVVALKNKWLDILFPVKKVA